VVRALLAAINRRIHKDTPEKHTKSCLQKCESSGYGVITMDGKDKKFVKFDSKGNDLTVEALKAAKKAKASRPLSWARCPTA
jgi:hypothetical protein